MEWHRRKDIVCRKVGVSISACIVCMKTVAFRTERIKFLLLSTLQMRRQQRNEGSSSGSSSSTNEQQAPMNDTPKPEKP